MSPTQCRMARAGLHLSREELCAKVGIARTTLVRFELHGQGSLDMQIAVRRTLEDMGARFLPAPYIDGVLICAAINGKV